MTHPRSRSSVSIGSRLGRSGGRRMLRRLGGLAAVLLGMSLHAAPAAVAADADDAWAALVKGGHVALIRHGNAPPGRGGDPPGFRIDDCRTQRNLDDAGREQARLLGEPSGR